MPWEVSNCCERLVCQQFKLRRKMSLIRKWCFWATIGSSWLILAVADPVSESCRSSPEARQEMSMGGRFTNLISFYFSLCSHCLLVLPAVRASVICRSGVISVEIGLLTGKKNVFLVSCCFLYIGNDNSRKS